MINRLRDFTRFYLVAIISGLILLGATVYIYLEVKHRVERRNKALFELRSNTVERVIEKRLYDYIQILKGGQGLFNVSDSVSQQDWHKYISSLEVNANYPGILGIGYSKLIRPQELEYFQSTIKKTTYSDFKVWPQGERNLYSAIVYLEPLSLRNRKAIGYDMYSDSTRREAMARAITTGQPALSGAVTLVQENSEDVQKGFLIYLPVYKNKSTSSPDSVQGFIYSPFRVNDLIRGTLSNRFSEIDIEIYDGEYTTTNNLLFDKEPSFNVDDSDGDLRNRTTISVGNHTWLVVISALPEFGYDSGFPLLLLLGGLLISTLLSFVMVSMADARQSAYLKQVITDNATAALFIVDKQGKCTFMNPAAELLTGFTFAELEAQELHAYLHHQHPDGRPYPNIDCPIVNVLKTQNPLYDHEEVFYKKSGNSFYASINTQPLMVKGKLMGHLLEVYDISAEKEAEEALHQKNRMLETLNALGTNLSAELNLPKLLQRITNSSMQLLSAHYGSLYYFAPNGEPLVHTADITRTEAFPVQTTDKLYKHVAASPQLIWSADMLADDSLKGLFTGNIRSLIAAPIRLRSGETVGAFLFGHPMPKVFNQSSAELIQGISAQAAVAIENSRFFETIKQKNRELTSTNNDLDNFVYSASHDLKAPVLNIEGLVKALDSPNSTDNPERQRKIMDMIRQSVDRFKGTIEALTEVAKTNKNINEDIRTINLPKKLQEVLESINDMVESSGAEINANLNCHGLKFSPAYTRSILQNLITNAIKYRHPDRHPIIDITCVKADDFYILSVADNGLGIAEHNKERLFTMFKRFHSHVEGTGVGLYLVRRILENNGGKIEVDTTEGIGTTFKVYFPQF